MGEEGALGGGRMRGWVMNGDGEGSGCGLMIVRMHSGHARPTGGTPTTIHAVTPCRFEGLRMITRRLLIWQL